MPFYEYECPDEHKHERLKPISQSSDDALCPECGQVAVRIMSVPASHQHGWKFLKDKSEKSAPAPSGSQYEPLWDQAYQGPQIQPKAKEV